MNNRLAYIKQYKSNNGKRYYKPVRYPNIPLSINDIYVITDSTDRLDLLANRFYKDMRLWWVIAIANRDILKRDSYAVPPGIEIRIPSNVKGILRNYEEMNNESY